MRRSHQVTANVEKVADESVHGQEALRLTGRFEPSHVSFALPCGLVRDFGAIVLVSVRAMGDRRHDRSVRRPVAAQLVGDQPPRLTLLALRGDILWRSRELPLKLILESIRIAYGSFYTTERLSSLLTKVPPAEAGTVQASYRTLARDRGLSWSAAVTGSLPSGSALPAVPDPC